MTHIVAVLEQVMNIAADAPADFMIVFSRFEYSLKRGGFLKNDHGRATADWDGFGQALAAGDATAIVEAGRYILDVPPMIEGVENGNVVWRDSPHLGANSDIERLLVLVRRVRNNLFHGGKFPPDQPREYARDLQLIEACMSVLERTLHHPAAAQVRQYFIDGLA